METLVISSEENKFFFLYKTFVLTKFIRLPPLCYSSYSDENLLEIYEWYAVHVAHLLAAVFNLILNLNQGVTNKPIILKQPQNRCSCVLWDLEW